MYIIHSYKYEIIIIIIHYNGINILFVVFFNNYAYMYNMYCIISSNINYIVGLPYVRISSGQSGFQTHVRILQR